MPNRTARLLQNRSDLNERPLCWHRWQTRATPGASSTNWIRRVRIGSLRTSVLCITHNTRSAQRQIGRRQGGATALVQRCTQEGNDKATTWPRTAAGLQTTVIHVSNSRDVPKSGFKLIFTKASRSFYVVSFLFALRCDRIACSRTSTITHNWNLCSCVRKKGAECAMHLQIAISLLF